MGSVTSTSPPPAGSEHSGWWYSVVPLLVGLALYPWVSRDGQTLINSGTGAICVVAILLGSSGVECLRVERDPSVATSDHFL